LPRLSCTELIEHRHQHKSDHQPDGHVFNEIVQSSSLACAVKILECFILNPFLDLE
jgi:hypothetical protein